MLFVYMECRCVLCMVYMCVWCVYSMQVCVHGIYMCGMCVYGMRMCVGVHFATLMCCSFLDTGIQMNGPHLAKDCLESDTIT